MRPSSASFCGTSTEPKQEDWSPNICSPSSLLTPNSEVTGAPPQRGKFISFRGTGWKRMEERLRSIRALRSEHMRPPSPTDLAPVAGHVCRMMAAITLTPGGGGGPIAHEEANLEDEFMKRFTTRTTLYQSHRSAGNHQPKGSGRPSAADNSTSALLNGTGRRRWRRGRTWRRGSSLAGRRAAERCALPWASFKRTILTPDSSLRFYWLAIVSLAVCYNWWMLIVREAYDALELNYRFAWFVVDVLVDLTFVCDIAVQFRTGYLSQGLVVTNVRMLAKRYITSINFLLDVLSLVPVDYTVRVLMPTLFYPLVLRANRLIKSYRLFMFCRIIESRTTYPNFIRVASLTHILLLGCHWFACFHYLMAQTSMFENSRWFGHNTTLVNTTLLHKYLLSLYWSTLTLTTIGNTSAPRTPNEYAFTIVSYLIGVFVFATIVGQVGNVITNRNASRLEFERLLDGSKQYMRVHKVPKAMQKRVQRWYDYSWSRGKMTGGLDIQSLSILPDKLKTELALHVNLDTLKRVSIFKECQPEFLHDLVLKMRAIIFTPGDIICRKGEIAREMYIIADGVLEVLNEQGGVITTMKSGDFFGEIGVLNLDQGTNRRTADVVSVGYSELFTLSRDDVLGALGDYPEAEKLLSSHGKKRLEMTRQHLSQIPEIRTNDNEPSDTKRPSMDSYDQSPLADITTSIPHNFYRKDGENSGVGQTAGAKFLSHSTEAEVSPEARRKVELMAEQRRDSSVSPPKTSPRRIAGRGVTTRASLATAPSGHPIRRLDSRSKQRQLHRSSPFLARRYKSMHVKSFTPSLVTNLLGCRVADEHISDEDTIVNGLRTDTQQFDVLEPKLLLLSKSPKKLLKQSEEELTRITFRMRQMVCPQLHDELNRDLGKWKKLFQQIRDHIAHQRAQIALKDHEIERLKGLVKGTDRLILRDDTSSSNNSSTDCGQSQEIVI